MNSAIVLRGADGLGETAAQPSERWAFCLALWRRRRLFVLLTLLGVLAGAVYLGFARPVYRSEAKLFLHRRALEIVGSEGNSRISNLQTQCSVITSTRILSVAAGHALDKAPRTLAVPHPVAPMSAGLAASVGAGEDLITLGFEGPEPGEAAVILQAVIDAYLEFHTEKKAQLLAQWQNDKGDLEREIEAQNKAINDLRGQTDAPLDAAGAASAVRDDLNSLREALSAAKVQAASARAADQSATKSFDPARVSALANSLRLSGTLPPVDSTAAGLQTQLSSARQHLREVRLHYMERHPDVLAAANQVAALEAIALEADRQSVESYLTMLKDRAALAAQTESSLAEQYRHLAQAVMQKEQAAAEIVRRRAALERAERRMDAVVTRLAQYNLDVDASVNTAEVVEYPSINLQPVSPHRARILMLALAMGLGVASCTCLLVNKLDQRVRAASELSQAMRLPVLASIPHLRRAPQDRALGRLVDSDPSSDSAEACRSIRTALFFSGREAEPRTILVTSAEPGEGKSTVASNLAIAIARAGRKVLLLDADLRKPVQQHTFQTLARGDLPRILDGGQTIESAVQLTEIENLSLLLCSRAQENPSELLNSAAFVTLLEELSLRYEFVVIDSPPVSVASDARILAAYCNASLLVVRAGHVKRSVVKLAYDALASVGGAVLGMVLNHAVHRQDCFGSYGYYYGGGGNGGGRPQESQPTPRTVPAASHPDPLHLNKTAHLEQPADLSSAAG